MCRKPENATLLLLVSADIAGSSISVAKYWKWNQTSAGVGVALRIRARLACCAARDLFEDGGVESTNDRGCSRRAP